MKQEGLSDTQALPNQQLTIHKLQISWHTQATNCSAWSQKGTLKHQPNSLDSESTQLTMFSSCGKHTHEKKKMKKKTGQTYKTLHYFNIDVLVKKKIK